nr:hypothetical protein [Tanacetum cinerariifolium]
MKYIVYSPSPPFIEMRESEDDFFLCGSSSDEADADDELTDKSARLGLVLKFMALTRMSTHVPILCWDQASSACGNEAAASGMSSNERNQTHISARTFTSLPRASNISSQVHAHQSRDPAIHQLMFSFFAGIKPPKTKLQLLALHRAISGLESDFGT